jgi:hypothetical protein
MAKIQIQIRVPIWKTRSVGISLINSSPEDDVEIEISYKNKDGNVLYPHVYGLKAKEIYAYGVKYVKQGVPLYEVPIADLKVIQRRSRPTGAEEPTHEVNKQLINNNNQKQLTMLFDNKEIEKIRKENSERGGGSNKKKIEKGEQLLEITGAEIAYTKKNKDPMIKVDFSKGEEYKPISEYYLLSGSGSDFGKSKLLAMLEAGFGYVMQQAKDEKDVAKQVKKFVGKKLKVAIQYEQSLYDTDKKGTVVALKPQAWYFGAENDASFKVDINKCEKPLSKEDMARVIALSNLGQVVTGSDGQPVIPVAGAQTREPSLQEKKMAAENEASHQEALSQATSLDTSAEDDGLPF